MLTYDTFEDLYNEMVESGQSTRAINTELRNIIASIPDSGSFDYSQMKDYIINSIHDILDKYSDNYISWVLDGFDTASYMRGTTCRIDIDGYLQDVDVDSIIKEAITNGETYSVYVPYNYRFAGRIMYDRCNFSQPHLYSEGYRINSDGSYEPNGAVQAVFDGEAYEDSDAMAESYRGMYQELIALFEDVGFKLENGLTFKPKDAKTFMPFIKRYLAMIDSIDY